MFEKQQKRTIQASVSKGSRGVGGGGGGEGSFSPIYTLVVVLALATVIAIALYLNVLHSFHRSTSPADKKIHSVSSNTQDQKDAVAAASDSNGGSASSGRETLVLKTDIGSIRIVLRPDLSAGSVEYVHRVLSEAGREGTCPGCRLYRAEKPGILQGILRKDVSANDVKGSCPPGSEHVPNDCPEWDKHCGCHGPVMTRGMVGWAAGTPGGPDFFINNYPKPAQWWGTQHTVWGQILDEDSFAVIDQVWSLPAKEEGGLTFLDKPLHFTVEMARWEA